MLLHLPRNKRKPQTWTSFLFGKRLRHLLYDFQVERSNDAQNFTPLITLPAGQLDGVYNYIDESPLSGENDYRVKLTGKRSDSAIYIYRFRCCLRQPLTISLRKG
jgi:hypothetical protein